MWTRPWYSPWALPGEIRSRAIMAKESVMPDTKSAAAYWGSMEMTRIHSGMSSRCLL